jgi:hypothetical protein
MPRASLFASPFLFTLCGLASAIGPFQFKLLILKSKLRILSIYTSTLQLHGANTSNTGLWGLAADSCGIWELIGRVYFEWYTSSMQMQDYRWINIPNDIIQPWNTI